MAPAQSSPSPAAAAASSSSSSPSPSSEKPQYHHFIPRFLLRNFAHDYYHHPKQRGGAKRHANKSGNRKKNGRGRVDQALHIIDLSSDTAELTESPVGRTYGLTDMYRDFDKKSDQHHVEKQLSKLEAEASRIITRIRKTFESGKQDVWLSRQEKDTLRKFLFIMKYRGKGYHKRFRGDETEGYVEEDKEIFLQYMHDKGFSKPYDVWLHSIKTILELKMDHERKWQNYLMNQIYPYDAEGFILHTECMYLALCTPSAVESTEFILTENCYNVFEGPQTTLIDPITNRRYPGAWTNFHDFAPISPKLIMILRSCLLPNPEEDMNPKIKNWRENAYKESLKQHADPKNAASILKDLPIKKATNTYSSMGANGLEFLEGEDGSRRSSDRFCFPFFKLSTEHVNKINMVFLDNASTTQAIAFTSKTALRTAIEYYITSPEKGFKQLSNEENDPVLSYLMKIENIGRKLGSDKVLIYEKANEELSKKQFRESMTDKLETASPEQPSEFFELYMKLGGTDATLVEDLDQVRKMVNMRIKIDVWSKGLAESKRQDIRDKLAVLFCQLPARRLWFYLKNCRRMSLGNHTNRRVNVMDGPEDMIVKVSHIIKAEKLGYLMHCAVEQHIFLLRHPDLDLDAPILMNESSARQLMLRANFYFGAAGTICDCGIYELEERAKMLTEMNKEVLQNDKTRPHPFWTDDEHAEMMTRWQLRKAMEDLLGEQVPKETLPELKDVLFSTVYPVDSKLR